MILLLGVRSHSPVECRVMPSALPGVVEGPVGAVLAFQRGGWLWSGRAATSSHRGLDQILCGSKEVIAKGENLATDSRGGHL